MYKQQRHFNPSLRLKWGVGLALVLAVGPILSASATAQVVIDQDTILESSVKDRMVVRDSAAGQTELRIAPQGEAAFGLEARDTAQVLVQGGTVRRTLDQFDRSRTVLEAGFIAGWNLADDAQGVMANGQAGVVKATGAAEFSMDAGKINRVEADQRSLLDLNAGSVVDMVLGGRSTTTVRAIDVKRMETRDQAGLRVWSGANVGEFRALDRSNVDLGGGAKIGRLTLHHDAHAEASGGNLGDVEVWDSASLRIQADVALASLLVRDDAQFEALGTRLPATTISDGRAALSHTRHDGPLNVQGNALVEIDSALFAGPGGSIAADGNSRVRMSSTSQGGMGVRLANNAVFEGWLEADPQSASPAGLNIGLEDRAIAKVHSVGMSTANLSVRDQAELDFSGSVGKLGVIAIEGGLVRLSSAVDEARINLNPSSTVHVLSGPITGTVEGRLSERQEPAELFLHARSYTPLPQGRFTADLQDGTKADLVADSDFQLILVDAAGQQQAVDRDLRFNPANGHFYKMIRTPVDDFGAAKAAAEAMSFQGAGHLATITSQQEEQFLADQFAVVSGDPWARGVWIGASDAAEEGVWRWVVGPEAGQEFYRGGCGFRECNEELVTFANWARTTSGIDWQPQSADHEDYVLWLTDRTLPAGSSGRWHDYSEDTSAGFLVEFEPLLGDADGDGQVSLADFGTVKSNFGRFGTFQQGDFNGDWTIDLNDFALLKQNFGQASATVAEPSAGLLAALALASLACVRRHSARNRS
jgi:hypothetical protein